MATLTPKTKYGWWTSSTLVKMGDAEWVEEPSSVKSDLITRIATAVVGGGLYSFNDFVGAGVERFFTWAESKGFGPNRKKKHLH